MNTVIKKLDIIINRCKEDLKDYDRRQLGAESLPEMIGKLEARVVILAEVVKELVEEIEEFKKIINDLNGG